jgi:hypothetical protein
MSDRMSPKRLVLSITYKIRVALEKPCKKRYGIVMGQSKDSERSLAALLPDTAERVNGTDTQTVPISELKVNDVVFVRPGTRVPADGTVVEGSADVDESMITGESRSVAKGQGGQVIAGTVAAGRKPSSSHYGSWGAYRSIRHHATRCRGAGFRVSHARSRRPCRRDPFLCGGSIWGDYFRLLVAFRGQRTCPDQNCNRPHHCLPTCSRTGHSARDCDLVSYCIHEYGHKCTQVYLARPFEGWCVKIHPVRSTAYPSREIVLNSAASPMTFRPSGIPGRNTCEQLE